MWRISSSLIGKCCYRNQKVTYSEYIRVDIVEIYRNGKKVNCAYITPDTRIIYRSESARMVYFIQISAEMWHFEESGQVVFHKMINSFLPEVFKRWHEQGAHHVVTIILFTSVDVSDGKKKLGQGEIATETREFFRVVVDQVHTSKWNEIMETLRYEFSKFDRDVLLLDKDEWKSSSDAPTTEGKIKGQVLPAIKGNLLQAISIATSLVSNKFMDRDLRRTGVQTLIITPGSGIFDVDYNLLYQTSLKLLTIEIGIDLVCLSRPPLHVTPLFRYRENGVVKHCVPSWLDISFWLSTDRYTNQWIPRCKLYEIQMMGVMENEESSMSIDFLPEDLNVENENELSRIMDRYDLELFQSQDRVVKKISLDETLEHKLYPASSAVGPETQPSPLLKAVANPIPTLTPPTLVTVSANPPKPDPHTQQNASSFLTFIGSKVVSTLIPKSSAVSSITKEVATVDLPGNKDSNMESNVVKYLKFIRKASTGSLRSDAASENGDKSVIQHITSKFPDIEPAKPQGAPLSSLAVDGLNSSAALPITSALPIAETSKKLKPPPTMDIPLISPTAAAHKRPAVNRMSSYGPKPSSGRSEKSESRRKTDTEERHSMWMTVDNPSNIPADKVSNITNYGRWQNVYPRKAKRRAVKWRSLKSPASLPMVTPIAPSIKQFTAEYNFNIYEVSLISDQSEYTSIYQLFHEMVAVRLAMGFQIMAREKAKNLEREMNSSNPAGVVEIIPENPLNTRIFMSMGSDIHRLACDPMQSNDYGKINVQTHSFNKLKFLEKNKYEEKRQRSVTYIKTRYDNDYKRAQIDHFSTAHLQKFRWNTIDLILTGYEDTVFDDPRMYRIRLVLIPVNDKYNTDEVPMTPTLSRRESNSKDFNPEEVRIEGLNKLMTLLQKDKYRSNEDSTPPKLKELVLDEILYYTTDSDFNEGLTKNRKPFSQPTERFNKSVSLNDLAFYMQKELEFTDRNWHWKVHKYCFSGAEFVSWLLLNFSDLNTQEDARKYGDSLRERGLFAHVEKRHPLLAGNYFYQLHKQYINKGDSRPSSTGTDGNGKSSDQPKRQRHMRTKSGHVIELEKSPTREKTFDFDNSNLDHIANESRNERKTLFISKAIKYNTDPNKFSKRPEVLTVHFDRIHNPGNCYQLRFEWLNTTPKFVDEAITRLSRAVEQYGHKMVQVPIQEISKLPETNLFTSLSRTRFALDPIAFLSKIPQVDKEIGTNSLPSIETGYNLANSEEIPPLYYHKYILKSLDYYLDVGPISKEVLKHFDVRYSWGKPFYENEQFVHRSGLVIVQVMPNGDFVFMTNFLADSRIGVIGSHSQQSSFSPEALHKELKDLCQNKTKLRSLFIKARAAYTSRGRSDAERLVTTIETDLP